MAVQLNKDELELTKQIISIGLSKAAESLSFFIREKVTIPIIDINVSLSNYNALSRKDTAKGIYLLTTEVKGVIKGKAYLLFDNIEVEKITAGNIPNNIKNDPLQKMEMIMAFLMEIDNIITASVITQFSNILNIKIYGDVPNLNILDADKLNEFLHKRNGNEYSTIYINSRFVAEKMDINPEFIWLLEDRFFEAVRIASNDKEKREKILKLI